MFTPSLARVRRSRGLSFAMSPTTAPRPRAHGLTIASHGVGLRARSLRERTLRPGISVARVCAAFTVALAVVVALTSASAALGAGGPHPHGRWSAHVTVRMTARQLGLPANASRVALARAAVRRLAPQFGVPGSSLGALDVLPGSGTGMVQLRQQVRGLRVLWSDVNVLFNARTITVVSGTLLPLSHGPLAGHVKVMPTQAVAIARRAVPGPDSAGAAQLLAFAGDPQHPRALRRAYVVEVDPTHGAGANDAPASRCVVIDAQTGRVLSAWWGSVAVTGHTAVDHGPHASAAAASQVLAQYEDGHGRTSLADKDLGSDIWNLTTAGNPFSQYDIAGATIDAVGNPTPLDGILGRSCG